MLKNKPFTSSYVLLEIIKKNTMKKLFIIAMLVIGLTTFAQERKGTKNRATAEKMSPEQRTEKHLKKLTTELNLNTVQSEQLKQLMMEQATKREAYKAKREEIKANQVKPSKEERQAFKKNRLEEKEAMESKMKTILTPEQYEKWQSLREMNKDKMNNKKRK